VSSIPLSWTDPEVFYFVPPPPLLLRPHPFSHMPMEGRAKQTSVFPAALVMPLILTLTFSLRVFSHFFFPTFLPEFLRHDNGFPDHEIRPFLSESRAAASLCQMRGGIGVLPLGPLFLLSPHARIHPSGSLKSLGKMGPARVLNSNAPFRLLACSPPPTPPFFFRPLAPRSVQAGRFIEGGRLPFQLGRPNLNRPHQFPAALFRRETLWTLLSSPFQVLFSFLPRNE